jgi:hypothetical protein
MVFCYSLDGLRQGGVSDHGSQGSVKIDKYGSLAIEFFFLEFSN